MFTVRYAQEKGGQKLHIVASFADGSVSTEALCGKKAQWRKTFNVPLAHCCKNCNRVDRLNGQNRMRQIIKSVLVSLGYA